MHPALAALSVPARHKSSHRTRSHTPSTFQRFIVQLVRPAARIPTHGLAGRTHQLTAHRTQSRPSLQTHARARPRITPAHKMPHAASAHPALLASPRASLRFSDALTRHVRPAGHAHSRTRPVCPIHPTNKPLHPPHRPTPHATPNHTSMPYNISFH